MGLLKKTPWIYLDISMKQEISRCGEDRIIIHDRVYLTLIVMLTITCALYWSDVDNSIFHGNYEKVGCALGILCPKATAPQI